MGILDFMKNDNRKMKSVEEPIDGYRITDIYKNISAIRNAIIPEGTCIGNRVALIHHSADKYTKENIELLLVPQKKIFGYIDDDKALKHIVYSLKQSDYVVARIMNYSKKEYEYNSTIDIAFFKKV